MSTPFYTPSIDNTLAGMLSASRMNATPIIPAESRLKVYVVPKNEEKARANKVKEIVASARRFPGKVIFVADDEPDLQLTQHDLRLILGDDKVQSLGDVKWRYNFDDGSNLINMWLRVNPLKKIDVFLVTRSQDSMLTIGYVPKEGYTGVYDVQLFHEGYPAIMSRLWV